MSTTTHHFAPEEIMAFVDSELSADRAQSISAHIESCVECRAVSQQLRSTTHALSLWNAGEPSAATEDRVLASAAKNLAPTGNLSAAMFQRTKFWTWKHWMRGLAVSATVAALLLIASLPSLHRSHRGIGRSLAQFPETKVARGAAEVDLEPWSGVGGVGQGSGGGMGPAATPAAKITTIDGGGDRFGHGALGKLQAREEKAMKEVPDSYQSWIPNGPMIARTVSLAIVVKDFGAGRAALDTILARRNGYAAGLNVATPQGAARTLQASLRIPAPQLAAAVTELKALGRVEAETQNGEEVTQQHADLLARLKNSRETEQRLQDVLRTRTGKVKDVLEVEEEIARVRGEIELMEAEQQTLEHRVSFATIDLKLAEEYKAELTTPAPSVAMQLRNALVDGFRTAFQSLLALVLFFAESGPTLLLWLMILSIPAWMLWRRYQRSVAMESTAGV